MIYDGVNALIYKRRGRKIPVAQIDRVSTEMRVNVADVGWWWKLWLIELIKRGHGRKTDTGCVRKR